MTTQYTTILKLALPVQGELSGTWGDVVNDNITQMVEQAVAGKAVINTWTGNSHTLTTADGTTSESRCAILELTDSGTALTGAGTVVCPTNTKLYIVDNNTAEIITVQTAAGTGVAVPVGKTMLVYCDGTNVVEGVTHANSLSLGTSTVTADKILDEDNMASDSATAIATQQSIKAYVDSQVGTVDTLSEILANGNTTGANDIDVDSAQKVQFRDADIYLNSSVDGQLDIVADTEIQIAATTVDLNGNLDVSGTALVAGVLTTTAATVFNGGFASNADSTLGTDKKVQFRDAAIYLNSSVDGQLDIVADGEVQIDTALVDINGNLDVSGTTNISGSVSFTKNAIAGVAISTTSRSSNTVTVTTSAVHGLTSGDLVNVNGVADTSFNGYFTVSVSSTTVFTYSQTGADESSTGGTSTEVVYNLNASGTALNWMNGPLNIAANSGIDGLEITQSGSGEALSITGGNATFADNAKAIFGAGSDLEIYHDGSNSYIKDQGTGNLNIQTNGVGVVIADTSASDLAVFNAGNGQVSLYNSGSLKLATTATGIDVTGSVTAGALLLTSFAEIRSDTATLYLENAANTRYYSTKLSGANPDLVTSYYDGTSVTERLRIDAAGNAGLGVVPSSWNSGYKAMQLLTGALYGTSSRDTNLGANVFVNAGGGYAYIQSSFATNYTQFNGVHSWYTAPSGTAGDAISFTQAMTLDASGNLNVGIAYLIGTSDLTQLTVNRVPTTGTIPNAARSTAYLNIVGADGGSSFNFYTASANNTQPTLRMTLDASGNLGLGVVPETWYVGGQLKALQIGGSVSLFNLFDTRTVLANNYYLKANGDDTYINTDEATQYYQESGAHVWFTAPSGTADTTITWSESMRIDASGNVGIGTSSPSQKLDVKVATDAKLLVQEGNTAGNVKMQAVNNAVSLNTNLEIAALNTQFFNGGTERMRIDASGNLLVGKTTTALATAGLTLGGAGFASLTRSGAEALNVNRLSSDGDLAVFYKDSVAVGSIGSISGVVSYINLDPRSGGTGIAGTNTDSIIPVTGTGAVADGTKDLGLTTARWRNLYLSGGVVFGATGGAVTSKTLDDYEEGTWTPTITNSTGSYTTQVGRYTKIGNLVYVNCNVNTAFTNTGTTSQDIGGLPFTSENVGSLFSVGTVFPVVGFNQGNSDIAAQATINTTSVALYTVAPTTGINYTRIVSNTFGTTVEFEFSLCYRAA
jgi:hypothetical protein